MSTLYFEKISKYNRAAEPITVSIPFAEGRLDDPCKLRITDAGRALPLQTRALANWPDGSVKWLLAHFQADLPGNADKTFTFDVADAPQESAPERTGTVSAVRTDGGVRVDTDVLSFLIPDSGFAPVCDVTLNGGAIAGRNAFGGFDLRVSGRELSTLECDVELEIEEAGPLRAVVLVRGTHRERASDGSKFLDLNGRVSAYAGKAWIEVEHQFVHAEADAELQLESLRIEMRAPADAGARYALGEGYYRTNVRTGEAGGEPVEMTIDDETIRMQSWEHDINSFYGDFWADWTGASGGVTLSVFQAHQNFPKALRADESGIVCELAPRRCAPIRVLRGMGKTHRLQLCFHAVDTPREEIASRSLQFQMPDRPSLTREWFRGNNPWTETFFPEKIPDRLITLFNARHDTRPIALGMMHFGDAPDAGYTDQGRGRGESVWVNNEYDRTHACTLYYGLTGQRRVLDSALNCARHWIDVDFCHASDDPLIDGGLKIHTAYHGTGGVTPSHEWIEGFLDFYFLTGRREGLDCAVRVAENMLRHFEAKPHLREPGDAAVREGGWALRAMVGMALGTGEKRWYDEARRFAEFFIEWHEKLGGMLAPYTSHSMPRVPFMICLTINSLARYLLLNEDDAPRIQDLIVATVDDMIEHCLGPDGVFYYKELPSLRRPAPTPHALEALTHAYRASGDQKYLKIAVRQFAAFAAGGGRGSVVRGKFLDSSGAVVSGKGAARSFADSYISILLFAAEAAPLGLLDWYEYPQG